jgi:hypothetical protein
MTLDALAAALMRPDHDRLTAAVKASGMFILRHCEEQSDEAIHPSARRTMDCFAEPVIGRAFARPGGSQ